MTGDEIGAALSVPKRSNYFGAYQGVISNLGSLLSDEQVTALVSFVRGVAKQEEGHALSTSDDGASKLAEATPQLLQLLDRRSRGERLLAQLTLRMVDLETRLGAGFDDSGWLIARGIRSSTPLVVPSSLLGPGAITADDSVVTKNRRALGLAVARATQAKLAVLIAHRVRISDDSSGEPNQYPLMSTRDFTWLMSQDHSISENRLATLSQSTYDPGLPAHVEVAYQQRNNPHFAWIRHWFEPMPIDGPEANQWRELLRDDVEPWVGQADHEQALRESWTNCLAGDVAAVVEVVGRLRIDPATGYDDSFPTEGILDWPGNAVVDIDPAVLADRCVNYLSSAQIPQGEWLSNPTLIATRAIELYAMLRLVADQLPPEELEQRLPPEAWSNLVPVVVRSHRTPQEPDAAADTTLLRILQAAVPSDLREAYLRWVKEGVDVGGDTIPSLWPLSTGADAARDSELLQTSIKIAELLCDTESLMKALPPSADAGTPEAKEIARLHQRRGGLEHSLRRLTQFLLDNDTGATLGIEDLAEPKYCAAVRSTVLLPLLVASRTPWSLVWSACQTDDELATKLVQAMASTLDWSGQNPLPLLTPDQLTELWLWLDARCSSSSEEPSDGFVTPEDRIRELRDALVVDLERRATLAALDALATLVLKSPGNWFLKSKLRAAEHRYRDETWTGTSAGDFMLLVEDASRTVVHDDASLFRLIRTLLSSLQERLSSRGG